MQKINSAIIALPEYSSYLRGLVRAFDFLGIKSQIFDYRKYNFQEKLIGVILKKPKKARELVNERLLNIVKIYRPDILITLKGEELLVEYLNSIRQLGTTTINWFPDDIRYLPLAKSILPGYDLFCHFDPYEVKLLENKYTRVVNLPFSSDILPTDSEPKSKEKRFPLSFVGNHCLSREKYLSSLKNFDLNIWGSEKWRFTGLANKYRGYCQFDKLSEVFESSEVNLNIQYESKSQGLVLRVFEVLASNSLLLTESRGQLGELFKIGKELDDFQSPKEMSEKIKYYLAHEKERNLIAHRGYLRVRNEHTYVHRLKTIIKLIK